MRPFLTVNFARYGMSTAMVDLSDPLDSAEFAAVDTQRLGEIANRHQRIAEFLRQEEYAALLVQRPSNFAWLTAKKFRRS